MKIVRSSSEFCWRYRRGLDPPDTDEERADDSSWYRHPLLGNMSAVGSTESSRVAFRTPRMYASMGVPLMERIWPKIRAASHPGLRAPSLLIAIGIASMLLPPASAQVASICSYDVENETASVVLGLGSSTVIAIDEQGVLVVDRIGCAGMEPGHELVGFTVEGTDGSDTVTLDQGSRPIGSPARIDLFGDDDRLAILGSDDAETYGASRLGVCGAVQTTLGGVDALAIDTADGDDTVDAVTSCRPSGPALQSLSPSSRNRSRSR